MIVMSREAGVKGREEDGARLRVTKYPKNKQGQAVGPNPWFLRVTPPALPGRRTK